jgi:hypothetical protein
MDRIPLISAAAADIALGTVKLRNALQRPIGDRRWSHAGRANEKASSPSPRSDDKSLVAVSKWRSVSLLNAIAPESDIVTDDRFGLIVSGLQQKPILPFAEKHGK